ncbi:cupin [Paenibacillus glycanilyticus]|uniref:Cupin n=1 Tax=Paenibacillus glycanilyticus TaxID=126569 RepID=A0ABQ6NPQ2_9BACL|nr:cupin domain-containing protein [Paenibacillus glycanilyticus]GMK47056.1 cupin [Paenibacillus glycanilyticus]
MKNDQETPSSRVIVHRNEDIEWFDAIPGEHVGIRVKGEDVNGAYSVFDLIMDPSYGVPIHIHLRGDEIFRVIEGKAHFYVDGQEFDAEVGEVVVVPKGIKHAFANFSDTPLLLSIMFTPAGDEHSFKDVFGKKPEEVIELAKEKYQIIIVGPPLIKNTELKK